MKFQSFAQLIQLIKTHQQFSNQIKLKRLKKQLEIISSYESPSTSINQIQLTSDGIELLVFSYLILGEKYLPTISLLIQTYSRLLVSLQSAQIYYLKKDSQYSQCKDLLEILLQGNNWGPSLMLSYFLDKIQTVFKIIRENAYFDSKMIYHVNQNNRKQFLQLMELKMFEVQQFTWKYLIKTTKKKLLIVTIQNFLLFSNSKNVQNIVLDFWKPITQITKAKASVSSNKRFNLQISFKQNDKQTKLYFGGVLNIEKILGYLNPIEMIERKILQLEKDSSSLNINDLWQDNEEMLKQFTQLIEHCSLKDNSKTQKYIKLMKEMLEKYYQGENDKQGQNQIKMKKQKIQEQEIQT